MANGQSVMVQWYFFRKGHSYFWRASRTRNSLAGSYIGERQGAVLGERQGEIFGECQVRDLFLESDGVIFGEHQGAIFGERQCAMF